MIAKSFLGRSENAVKARIWISLINLMLMICLKFLRDNGWALSNFFEMARLRLTARADLLALIMSLKEPTKPPSVRERVVKRLFWPDGDGFRYPGGQL